MNRRALGTAQSALILLFASTPMPAQAPKPGIVKPLSEVKFSPDDDVKCLASAAENGDPATGASTFILKAPPNCLVTWHYHTAEEQLIVTSGFVLTEMGSMPSRTLGPGGFAMMPSKEKHQFSCKSKTPCIMFVTFDRAYDIFWVHDSQSSKKILK
jgi:quercetin dioxygenase-like cupin family protein